MVFLLFIQEYASDTDALTRALNNGFLREVCTAAKCPAMAFLEGVSLRLADGREVPATGSPKGFISHAWGAPLHETVGAVAQFLADVATKDGEDLATQTVWFDGWCLNQWREIPGCPGADDEMLALAFFECIKSSGRTLFASDPWNSPAALERLWCLIEVYYTASLGVKFQVVLGPAQKRSFLSALTEDCECWNKVITELKVEKATAFDPNDVPKLQGWILNGTYMLPGSSFEKLDQIVVGVLRKWAKDTAMQEVAEHTSGPDGDIDPDFLKLADQTGRMLVSMGDYAAASELMPRVLAGRRKSLGNYHSDTLTSATTLGILLYSQGKLSEAEPLYREALQGREYALGPDHPETHAALNRLGSCLNRLRKYDEAEPLLRRGLKGCRARLGDARTDTLDSMSKLGLLLKHTREYTESEQLLREVMTARTQTLGHDHPQTLASINNLGAVLTILDKLDEAEALLRDALVGCETKLGIEHPYTLNCKCNLGSLLKERGKLKEAANWFQKSLNGRRKKLGDQHPQTLAVLELLGSLLVRMGTFRDADPLLKDYWAAHFVQSRCMHLIKSKREIDIVRGLRKSSSGRKIRSKSVQDIVVSALTEFGLPKKAYTLHES